jgi:hypothetical protein
MIHSPRKPPINVAQQAQKIAAVGDITSVKQGVGALRSKAARATIYANAPGQMKGQVGTESISAGATATITFPNNFAFSSGSTYVVKCSFLESTTPTGPAVAFEQSATGFKIVNLDSANRTVCWNAEGT